MLTKLTMICAMVLSLACVGSVQAHLWLQVDMGAGGQPVKDGFIEWSDTHSMSDLGGTNIDASLTWSGSGTGMEPRNRGGGPLTSDFYHINDHEGTVTIQLVLGDLDDGGSYTLTTWHNIPGPDQETYNIEVDGVVKVTGLALTNATNDDDAASATYDFTASGTSATINFIPTTGPWGNVAFNGFELTPEPATIALLGLGGLALLRRRK